MENKKKKKGNILLFYLIAFGWSWLFWVPLILVENGISLPQGIINFLNSPYNPAAWGPLISALFVTYLYQRGPGLRSLIRRGVDFRFGFIWYIAAIFLFPAILGFAYFAAMLSGESMPELVAFADPISIPISFVFYFSREDLFKKSSAGVDMHKLDYKKDGMHSWHPFLLVSCGLPGTCL
jgi:hypothetical protein